MAQFSPSFRLTTFAAVMVIVLGLSVFGLVAGMFQHELLEPYLPQLLIVNTSCVLILAGVLCFYLVRLGIDWRKQIPGSKLTMRFIRAFATLLLLSLIIVYLFAFFALNRGVDSSINIRIDNALEDAVQLGEVTVEAWKDKLVGELEPTVAYLSTNQDPEIIAETLLQAREVGDFTEIAYFDERGDPTGISASKDIELTTLVPPQLDETMLPGLEAEESAWRIIPSDDEGLHLRILIRQPKVDEVGNFLVQILTPLPESFQELSESIESAREDYSGFLFLVGSLKFNLILALSFVAILVLLFTTLIAIFFAQRLSNPIRQLSEGTLAVAKGDYDKRLEVETSDDLGVLVDSFNRMTSEIKFSNEEVRRSHLKAEQQGAYLQTVLQHLSMGVLLVDNEARLIDMNLAASEIIGLNLDAVKNKKLAELTSQKRGLQALSNYIQRGIESGVEEWVETFNTTSEHGTRIWTCRATRLPMLVDSSYGRFVVVIEDITVLLNAQRTAAWGEVSQRFAHEVRNPLTPITLAVERIHSKMTSALAPDVRESIEGAFSAIFRQLNSLTNTVNQFRDYAQITQLNPQRIDLNALIRETTNAHMQDDSSSEISLELDRKISTIDADPDRLVQVLNNLLINARHALEDVKDPQIKIKTSKISDDEVEIKITDNGHGFNERILNTVFEPYTTTKGKSTGLGLAIVRRIIEEHGGSVSASNSAAGGGEISLRLFHHDFIEVPNEPMTQNQQFGSLQHEN